MGRLALQELFWKHTHFRPATVCEPGWWDLSKPLNPQTGILCRELCQHGKCGCKGLVSARRLWTRAGFGVLLASSPATPMSKSSSRDKLIWMCFALSVPSEKDEIQDYCPDPCSPNKNDGGVSTCRLWHDLGLWYLFLLPLVLSFSFLIFSPPKRKKLQAQTEPKSHAGKQESPTCFWHSPSHCHLSLYQNPTLGWLILGFFSAGFNIRNWEYEMEAFTFQTAQ